MSIRRDSNGGGRENVQEAGLVFGIVMLVCYLFTAFESLFGLIVVTSGYDLLWYLHPIVVIVACILAIRRRKGGRRTS